MRDYVFYSCIWNIVMSAIVLFGAGLTKKMSGTVAASLVLTAGWIGWAISLLSSHT